MRVTTANSRRASTRQRRTASSGEERPTDRLDEFLAPFAAAFRRRDQVRWFRAYLAGLLREGPRKSIEAIARDHSEDSGGAVAQSLQNFVNQSPWDERLLWTRLRSAAAERFAPPWIGVLDEVGIVKQGRHSVGVHRQYAGEGGHKQNCQVARADGVARGNGVSARVTALFAAKLGQ